MSRRARHVAGLAMWAADRPSYRLKLGSLVVPFDMLTDDALTDLRTRLARDLRQERRRVEANRPFYVADAIRAGHRLPPETMAFAAALLGAGTIHAA